MQVSMPSASTSTFIRPSSSMSSLSHSMKVRSVHGGVADGDQLVEPPARQDEAADMLGEMARKAEEPAGKLDGAADHRVVRVEPGLRGSARRGCRSPQLPHCGVGEAGGDVLGQAQRLADLADGAAGAIADHGGGDAGALAAVALVDVLDDLLAPLVLEIDVDVGRLAAFRRDEAREEQVVLVGIDGGDAEHVADGGIGRRAAALAQDAA